MNNSLRSAHLNLALVSFAALALAACDSSGSYRVASVGQVPADAGSSTSSGDGSGSSSSAGTTTGNGSSGSTGGGSGSGGSGGGQAALGGNLLVTAGNTVMGVANKHDQLATSVNGKLPVLTPVTGTVTKVLVRTGQTLVDLGGGRSLILNGAGGRLGELVTIDLGSKKVIGTSSGSSLLGASVLSPIVATGSVAAVNAGNGASLVALGNGAGTTGATGVVSNLSTTVNGALGATASPGGVQANGVLGATGALGLKAKK